MALEITTFDYGLDKRRKTLTPDGYVLVYIPEHPRAHKNGCVREHRLIMEIYLKRYLNDDEDVHHINCIKHDNRIENLELLSHGEHSRITHLGNMYRRGRHQDTSDRFCFECGSKTTRTHMPSKRHKTPVPHWYHLHCDKVNWYCYKCFERIRHQIKKKLLLLSKESI